MAAAVLCANQEMQRPLSPSRREGTQTPAARRISRFFRRLELVSPVAWMVIDVPWRLRHPRRLTVLAIAAEAPNAVYGVLRAARPCSGAGRGSPPTQPWSQPDR
jgi:hypothetical protein